MAIYRTIAEKVIEEYDWDWEGNLRRKEACINSVEMLLANIIDVGIVLLVAMLLGLIKEAGVFFVTFAALRYYAGGVHAKNYVQCVGLYICILLSSIYCANKWVSLPDVQVYGICIAGMLVAAVVNYKYAAMQREIGMRQEEFRKKSLSILIVMEMYFLIVGIVYPYIEDYEIQNMVKKFILIQAFALLAQGVSLFLGRTQCVNYKKC